MKKIYHVEAKKRIEELHQLIGRHDALYYVQGKPEISDVNYDALFNELKALEEQFPELTTPDSPTQRVGGAPVDFLPEFKHRVPLLSLESLFKPEEVENFDKRIRKETKPDQVSYVVDPKFDGLSVEIVYRDGLFHQAGTRGDGVTGEEVTRNVKTIKSLPLKLSGKEIPKELHLRAEVILTLKGFDRLNKKLIEEGEEPFANPRNAASGSLRQLDSRISARRPLDIYFYGLLYADSWKPKTQWDVLTTLQSWGLRVNPLKRLCKSVDEILDFHRELYEQRDELDYEIDGIVAKIDDLKLQAQLGERARSPRWAFALKFEPRKEITRVENIVLQVGRQGTLTPVAILKPVDVGGVTVSRATLHNLDIIKKLDVRVGDEVKVARAGDVIPEVVSVNLEARKGNPSSFEMPSRCPVCGALLSQEGAFFFCTGGYTCRAQLKWSIIHFASRRAMDIEGLGKETVEALLAKKLISHSADIYLLTKDQLLTVEGFKDKKAQNLLDGIETSKTCSLYRLLFGLGIRHVGEQVAKIIADHFGSLQVIEHASLDDIQSVKGIGPEIAQSVVDYFADSRNKKLLKLFLERGVCPVQESTKVRGGRLAGQTFVFTGELETMSRDQAQMKIEELGGRGINSVSQKTNFVVAGKNPGSKFDKAKKLGVKVLNEREFIQLIS